MKLSAVFEVDNKICAVNAELERLREASTAITSELDGMPRTKFAASPIERLTVKIDDYERRLMKLVEDKTNAQVELTFEILARVTGTAAKILLMRYVSLKPFAKITDEIHYSEATIYRLHRRGVRQFGE